MICQARNLVLWYHLIWNGWMTCYALQGPPTQLNKLRSCLYLIVWNWILETGVCVFNCFKAYVWGIKPLFFLIKSMYNKHNLKQTNHQHIIANLIKGFTRMSWTTSPWAFVNWLGSLGLWWKISFTIFLINSNGYLDCTIGFIIQSYPWNGCYLSEDGPRLP